MEQQEHIQKLADEYYEEGRARFFDHKLEEAAMLVQNALHLYKKCDDMLKYATALNMLGVIYGATGNESMAVDYLVEGLECAIDYQLNNITALFYNNIGSRYQELGEHEKAIDYFLKSARELQNPTCIKEERYRSWTLITYLNLAVSYYELNLYELSYKYLEQAERQLDEEVEEMYHYTVLIFKCRLLWQMEKGDYVYEHMEDLLASGEKDSNASDYLSDMKDLCQLFRDMKEYEYWKQTISAVETYTIDQNTVFFRLFLTELWMDYYQTVGNEERYVELCVAHADLYKRQKAIDVKDRATAIDIKVQLREKEAERKRVETMSVTDALTGLGNRYSLEREAVHIIRDAGGERITVGVLDIDCFKQLNDTYGHIQGDRCLKVVADILKEAVMDCGHVYRFGGDEFVMLFPAGMENRIEGIAEAILQKIAEAGIANEHSVVQPNLTISQGYACFVPEGTESGARLIEHADKALYYVKRNSRNAYYIIRE